MKCPERLHTARLVLRRPATDDAAEIFNRYAADERVGEFLSWPIHTSIGDTLDFIEWSDREWEQWPAGPYLVLSADESTLLGSTGLSFEGPHKAATGYAFATDAWGKGYATESLRAMQDLAVAASVERLYALCHPEHAASRRVLEKAGFELEGTLRNCCEFPNRSTDGAQDVVCYSWIPAGADAG